MLENLIKLVKENAGDAIINNPEVPNEKNNMAVEVTGNSIFDTLKNSLSNGKVNSITDFFQNDDTAVKNSLVTENAKSNVVQNLMQKLGLGSGVAGSIASSLVPVILGKLVSKTKDPHDSSFNISDIVGNLTKTGGKGFDLGGLLGKL